jgi:hypothetical protein
MSWTREITFYLDLDSIGTTRSPLLTKSGSTYVRTSPGVGLVASDCMTCKLYFLRESGGTWATEQLTGTTPMFCGKQNPDDENCLFSITDLAIQDDGTDYWYQGTLDLNTTQVAAAMTAAGTANVSAHIDIELQEASTNATRATIQFPFTLKQQYYTGDEGEPTSGDPSYPVAGTIVTKNIGIETMTGKTAEVDISGCSFSAAPQILATVESSEMVFCVVSGITAAKFDVEVSSYVAGTKIHWLAIS